MTMALRSAPRAQCAASTAVALDTDPALVGAFVEAIAYARAMPVVLSMGLATRSNMRGPIDALHQEHRQCRAKNNSTLRTLQLVIVSISGDDNAQ